MRKDLINLKPLQSSFLTCETEMEQVIKILFIDNQPYSNMLKRLLVINSPDCLDKNNMEYNQIVQEMTIQRLRNEGYLNMTPRIKREEHSSLKSSLIIFFDSFMQNVVSPEFLDYSLRIDIICPTDSWEMENYQVRPIKIAGYIDGIFQQHNDKRLKQTGKDGLTGMGEYTFLGCTQHTLNEDLATYEFLYSVIKADVQNRRTRGKQ